MQRLSQFLHLHQDPAGIARGGGRASEKHRLLPARALRRPDHFYPFPESPLHGRHRTLDVEAALDLSRERLALRADIERDAIPGYPGQRVKTGSGVPVFDAAADDLLHHSAAAGQGPHVLLLLLLYRNRLADADEGGAAFHHLHGLRIAIGVRRAGIHHPRAQTVVAFPDDHAASAGCDRTAWHRHARLIAACPPRHPEPALGVAGIRVLAYRDEQPPRHGVYAREDAPDFLQVAGRGAHDELSLQAA